MRNLRIDLVLDLLRDEVFESAAEHGKLSNPSGRNVHATTTRHEEYGLLPTQLPVNDTHRELRVEVCI